MSSPDATSNINFEAEAHRGEGEVEELQALVRRLQGIRTQHAARQTQLEHLWELKRPEEEHWAAVEAKNARMDEWSHQFILQKQKELRSELGLDVAADEGSSAASARTSAVSAASPQQLDKAEMQRRAEKLAKAMSSPSRTRIVLVEH